MAKDAICLRLCAHFSLRKRKENHSNLKRFKLAGLMDLTKLKLISTID